MDLRNGPITKKPVKKRHTLRNIFIAFAGVLLTTFAVQATDTVKDVQESLVSNAVTGVILETNDGCPNGMVFISDTRGGFCIDTFEASPSEGCPYNDPQNTNETHANIIAQNCYPESRKGNIPWRNVSQTQAIELCGKASKHLASSEEWFLGSLGTPDLMSGWKRRDCNVAGNWKDGGLGPTGSGDVCKSSQGAYDMIGNVWEWTSDTATMGMFKSVPLPENGYIQGVTTEGIPLETGDTSNLLYYGDRFWVDHSKFTGIFRGGYFRSGSDAGRFAVHAETAPSFSGDAIGFRCAR